MMHNCWSQYECHTARLSYPKLFNKAFISAKWWILSQQQQCGKKLIILFGRFIWFADICHVVLVEDWLFHLARYKDIQEAVVQIRFRFNECNSGLLLKRILNYWAATKKTDPWERTSVVGRMGVCGLERELRARGPARFLRMGNSTDGTEKKRNHIQ